jgi:hypothetical protein
MIKNIFYKLLCFIGKHDWEYLPSPEGIMDGLFGPRKCRRCPEKFDGFPYPDIPMPPWKEYNVNVKINKEKQMPGPVSDGYDPEFGTVENAEHVKEGLREVLSEIRNKLGEELKDIVEVSLDENSEYDMNHEMLLSERQLRLIRFSILRALETI